MCWTWERTIHVGWSCWLVLQALFMTASVPTATSITATRTMAKGLFMVTSRPRPLTGRIFVIQILNLQCKKQ